MEFGEAAQETCVRESLEETGLKVKVKSLLVISTDFIQHYPNRDIAQAVVIEFLVDLVGKKNKKSDSETLELKYFSKDNLPDIFNKQHLNFIEHYYKRDYPFFE